MKEIERFWNSIPRGVKYVAGSILGYLVSRRLGMGEDEARAVWGIGGGALLGKHVAMDLAALLRGGPSEKT